uniref:Uncharacterized protein n=1 Tax=viral metagenome TaxID=1070528 RepID=A0A6C0M2H2_9ZZZZ
MDTFTVAYADPLITFTFSSGSSVSYTASLLRLEEDYHNANWILVLADIPLGTTILDWTQMTVPAGTVSRRDAMTRINALILDDKSYDIVLADSVTATSVRASKYTTTVPVTDFVIRLGDAAGATALSVEDSGIVPLFSISSVGVPVMSLLSSIVSTNASKVLVQAPMATYISGTASRVTSTDVGGTVVISTPQNVGVTSNLEFETLTHTGRYITNGQSFYTFEDGATQNSIDVSNISIIRMAPSTGPVTINGLANGTLGQHVMITKVTGTFLYITHNSPLGTQKILCPDSKDLTFVQYGAVCLYFDGTYWRIEEQGLSVLNNSLNLTLVTASTSTTTGTMTVVGGVGVGGNVTSTSFTPAVVPVASGSRGGNVALTNLLSSLATLKLITNSTSA